MEWRRVTAAHVVSVPGDKSLTHRALIFSALAQGRSIVANLQTGEDAHATARALRALGCSIPALPSSGAEIAIDGRGLHGLTRSDEPLDCANSGTTARLLLGVLAGSDFRTVLTGDASLRTRPMRRVTEPLGRMGARFEELGESDRLPIAVHGGRLEPIDYDSPHASAQIKSALLLAGLTGRAAVRVTEPTLSRDHTERMLSEMGADIHMERDEAGRAVITIAPVESLSPMTFAVPGDFSAAAFFIALGLLSRRAVRVDNVGLNPGRTGLLPVLARMGARIAIENVRRASGEPVGDVVAEPSRLSATVVEGAEIPALIDEVPILAVLAARAEGDTTIQGAGELRVKESDRLAALATNLRAVGVDAVELPDGLLVRGTRRLLEGRVRSHRDHRIAMAFGVLSTITGSRIVVDDPAVAAVSFPRFWDELRACTEEAASA
jgi:3-phosphoshikimate 1-carboxyvinyltransferase